MEMGEADINAFLTHLATTENVSASTQNQALSALLFLYRRILERDIGTLGNVIRARKSRHVPVVLKRDEAKSVIGQISGDKQLIASLMYGAALRWGRVPLPDALDRKFPNASIEWRWQSVFPQEHRWINRQTSQQGRHHVDESIVQKAFRQAVAKAGLTKRATCHTLRDSFATHLLEDGYDI